MSLLHFLLQSYIITGASEAPLVLLSASQQIKFENHCLNQSDTLSFSIQPRSQFNLTIPHDECQIKSHRGMSLLFKADIKFCIANRLF